MKVLGFIVLGNVQCASLVDGGELCVFKDQFREHVSGKAHVGDLLWVKEPYTSFVSTTTGGKRKVHAVLWGRRTTRDFFDGLGNSPLRPRGRVRPIEYDGRYLQRDATRATLEIIGLLAEPLGVRCRVHLHQIDKFLQALGAKTI